MSVRKFAAVWLITVGAAAGAADSGFQCNPDGNQQEMNTCAVQDYKAADKALNSTYKRVLEQLTAVERNKLRQEQRAWLKKRDPTCKAAAASSEGGSIWPLEFFGCLAELTTARTAQLETKIAK